ncbi:MAG: tetratricopeptide repeat protein, partial [candidate division Zixibacteria bacterium]|nr:tetratricopeptide repeat protein [candidate division Zixibacteria bacterium]
DAIKRASRVLNFYPKSKYVDDALLIIGKSYYYQKEYAGAERKFTEIIVGFPKSDLLVESQYFLGLTHYKLEEYDKAQSAWDAVLASRKKGDYQSKVLFMKAQVSYQQEDYQQALASYGQYLSQHKGEPNAVDAQLQIAQIYWDKEEYELSWKAYSEVRKYTRDKDIIYKADYKAGETAYQLGKVSEGLSIYKKLAEDPLYYRYLSAIKVQLGQGHLLAGQVAEARKIYDDVIVTYPKSDFASQAYYQIGVIYEEHLDSLDLAKQNFTKAKDERQGSPYSQKALQKLADLAKLEEFHKALTVAETEKLVQTRFHMAEFYLTQLDKPDSALAAYREIVQKYPDSEYAPKSLLASAYICRNYFGDSAGFHNTCEEIIQKYPGSDYSVEAIKMLNLRPDEVDRVSASRLFEEAEQQLFELSNPDSADMLYQQILDYFPNSVYVPRALLGKAYILEQNYLVPDDSLPGDSTVYRAYAGIVDSFPESQAASVARLKLGIRQAVQPKPAVKSDTSGADSASTTPTPAPGTAVADTADTLILGLPAAPEPLSKGIFNYPPELIEQQIRGYVELRIEIDYFTGLVKNLEVGKGIGNEEIEKRVMESMKSAKFDTQRLNPNYFDGIYGYRFKVDPPLSPNQ